MTYLGLIIDDSAKALMTPQEIITEMDKSINKLLKQLKDIAYLKELKQHGFYHKN